MGVSATARFTVTVDIPLGAWNEAETFKQLRVVAAREGLAKLEREMANVDFRVVGQPKLITMMTKED